MYITARGTAAPPPVPVAIAPQAVASVAVWSYLAGVDDGLASDHALLDVRERARAARFRFERDRRRYIAGHAFARRVLAQYVSRDPAEVRIDVGPNGKPALVGYEDWSFNLSHDDDLTVLAVSDGRPVGIDVERLRPIERVDDLAAGLFSPVELEAIAALDPSARSVGFLSVWTRKEAVVKAMGTGLAFPLAALTLVEPEGTVLARPYGADREAPFAFAPFEAPHGYIGAVACAGERMAVGAPAEGDPRWGV